MSIFVSIASYRDEELPKTVKSLYDNADRPEDLVIGIISQDIPGKHKRVDWLKDQVRFVEIDAKDAKGAGYARQLAMDLYNDEDYFFQIDSHMRFASGWDTDLKDMLSWCQEEQGTEKIILSQFTAPYIYLDDGSEFYPEGDENFWSEPSWTSVTNTWTGVWAGRREKLVDVSVPNYSHTILAGLLFAPGRLVKEIPYDPRISFMGEELCFAIRAYTRGWHIYAPHKMVAWHFYKREENPKVWHDNLENRSWVDIEMNSRKAQRRVLLGIESGIFGIEDYKKYLEYQKMIDIDFTHFYANNMNVRANLGILSEEIMFDDQCHLIHNPMSGYCLKDIHDKCFMLYNCNCICHQNTDIIVDGG